MGLIVCTLRNLNALFYLVFYLGGGVLGGGIGGRGGHWGSSGGSEIAECIGADSAFSDGSEQPQIALIKGAHF